MTEIVHVGLGDRAYEIKIGAGILDGIADHLAPFLKRPKVAIVTDETVADLHLERLLALLGAAGIEASHLALPAGEATKSWPHLETVVEWLLAQEVERNDLVIAFGGGVIGDLVGFAASTLRRGVPFVQIPTTLLAQVDSSVGGKTAINSAKGKNLIGAFYQPKLVLCDLDLLQSLSPRDFLAGYGEVMKYGLLGDEKFFTWLEDNVDQIKARDVSALAYAVKRSCQMKAEIVARDETEQGDRALLNLGHTYCHALEAATGYSDRLLHGEGVGLGCALAFETSMRLGLCSQEAPSRVRAHLKKMGMKTDLREIEGSLPSPAELVQLMYQDKKTKAGKLTFIMARTIGAAFVTQDVNLEVVEAVLSDSL